MFMAQYFKIQNKSSELQILLLNSKYKTQLGLHTKYWTN